MTARPDFWRSSGFHLLERRAGRLVVTADFLRAYLARPELRPTDEACTQERALFEALLDDPGLAIAPDRLGALADVDAAENFRVFLAYRDWLVAHDSLESAYAALFRPGAPRLPGLFVDHLVHAILRGLLDDDRDPIRARAAELLFRPQKVTVQGDLVMVADAETVAMRAATGLEAHAGLLEGQVAAEVELDVLDPNRADDYWARSDRFDTVLDIGFTRPGLDALARVLEAWVRHMLGIDVRIEPRPSIHDERWSWHLGLDAESSALLNDLYQGVDIEQERMARLLALFRLTFADPGVVIERLRGRPVYLGLATSAEQVLRLKPQNLLVNLPLEARA